MGAGPCWRWKWPRRARRGGYGRVALCSTENRGASALELATMARTGLRRDGEAGDGHGKAREARILQIRWRLACGGRRRATRPWKLLLSGDKKDREIQRGNKGRRGTAGRWQGSDGLRRTYGSAARRPGKERVRRHRIKAEMKWGGRADGRQRRQELHGRRRWVAAEEGGCLAADLEQGSRGRWREGKSHGDGHRRTDAGICRAVARREETRGDRARGALRRWEKEGSRGGDEGEMAALGRGDHEEREVGSLGLGLGSRWAGAGCL